LLAATLGVLGSFFVVASPAIAAAEDLAKAFILPEGFEVSLYAGPDLADDIYSMTLDAQGRVAVAGRGYVKVLHDDNGDGRADRATLFSRVPRSGAQGMFFDGRDLICTGDGALRRIRGQNESQRADDHGDVWLKLANPEHGAHAVRRGPDGWFYVICGNDAGVTEKSINMASSPVKAPHSGTVLRISPDGRQHEVLAHGFRNPYRLAFDWRGRMFTVDADGERAFHLPWYSPSRLFDVALGRHHGWVQSGWRGNWARPAYFFDNVPRLVELGRGSPTGLVCYRHRQFPRHFRGGLFSACWTLGKIYYLPLEAQGASYASHAEPFLETTGDVGFAPVDLAVGPQGDLFVAIGGRGTRGSVFRIRYKQGQQPLPPREPLERVLSADQPLSSWSRARWVPLARQLGAEPFRRAWSDPSRQEAERIRALEVLVELFGGIAADEALAGWSRCTPTVKSRLIWALAHGTRLDRRDWSLIARATAARAGDVENPPEVQRAAWKALARLPVPDKTRQEKQGPRLSPALDIAAWRDGLSSSDRRIRAAAILVARRGKLPLSRITPTAGMPRESKTRLGLARLWLTGAPDSRNVEACHAYFNACLRLLSMSGETSTKLESLRLVEIGCGDLVARGEAHHRPPGYWARDASAIDVKIRRRIADKLSAIFPSGQHELDREITRTAAVLEVEARELVEKMAARWSADTSPVDDVHELIVVSTLPGKRSETVRRQTADCLCRLHGKLAARSWTPSRMWPLRVGEAFERLVQNDPQLAHAVMASPYFGRPEHGLFVARMPKKIREPAARTLLAKLQSAEAEGHGDRVWTVELVGALAVLPDEEIFSVLRGRWQNAALRDAIAFVLARNPKAEDRGRLVESLDSFDASLVRSAAKALEQLKAPGKAEEIGVALKALKRQCQPTGEAALRHEARTVRRELDRLLAHWTGRPAIASEPDDPSGLASAYQPWFEWFAKTYPDLAARGARSSLGNWTAWQKRFQQIDFSRGDANQGKRVFERKACHQCHRDAGRLGPALGPAVRRFGRDDLLSAVIDPSRDVSPLYHTVSVVTQDGRVFYGLPIYESPESTLLQTGPATTIRVAHVIKTFQSKRSLMPNGLLDGLDDQAIADLYAYLRTLADQR